MLVDGKKLMEARAHGMSEERIREVIKQGQDRMGIINNPSKQPASGSGKGITPDAQAMADGYSCYRIGTPPPGLVSPRRRTVPHEEKPNILKVDEQVYKQMTRAESPAEIVFPATNIPKEIIDVVYSTGRKKRNAALERNKKLSKSINTHDLLYGKNKNRGSKKYDLSLWEDLTMKGRDDEQASELVHSACKKLKAGEPLTQEEKAKLEEETREKGVAISLRRRYQLGFNTSSVYLQELLYSGFDLYDTLPAVDNHLTLPEEEQDRISKQSMQDEVVFLRLAEALTAPSLQDPATITNTIPIDRVDADGHFLTQGDVDTAYRATECRALIKAFFGAGCTCQDCGGGVSQRQLREEQIFTDLNSDGNRDAFDDVRERLYDKAKDFAENGHWARSSLYFDIVRFLTPAHEALESAKALSNLCLALMAQDRYVEAITTCRLCLQDISRSARLKTAKHLPDTYIQDQRAIEDLERLITKCVLRLTACYVNIFDELSAQKCLKIVQTGATEHPQGRQVDQFLQDHKAKIAESKLPTSAYSYSNDLRKEVEWISLQDCAGDEEDFDEGGQRAWRAWHTICVGPQHANAAWNYPGSKKLSLYMFGG